MRKPIIIASLLLCAAVFAPEVRAGEIADKAAQAEEHLAAARYEEAMKALEEAQDKLWADVPLMFRRALFTAGEPVGYGVYDLRGDSVFKRSEKLIIYSEPMGYGFGRDGSLYVIDLALDFIVKGADGAEVARQEKFGNLTFRSRFPNKEFMARVTYDFSGLPAGQYTVTTVARDAASGKSAEFTLPFTLVD